jgi:hypothetical protein
MLFYVQGFEVPNWDSYLERNDSFKQEVPRYNPTVGAMKGTTIKVPPTLSCKKDGPAYFILTTHYLQHRNLAGIRGVLIQSSRSRRQITISIADCCFARVTAQ